MLNDPLATAAVTWPHTGATDSPIPMADDTEASPTDPSSSPGVQDPGKPRKLGFSLTPLQALVGVLGALGTQNTKTQFVGPYLASLYRTNLPNRSRSASDSD